MVNKLLKQKSFAILFDIEYFAYLMILVHADRVKKNHSLASYSPKIKYSPPYYISPIEIGLLWTKITYLKSHSKALVLGLQRDTK